MKNKSGKEIRALKRMSDKDIDYSDIPELDFDQFGKPVQGKFYRQVKNKLAFDLT